MQFLNEINEVLNLLRSEHFILVLISYILGELLKFPYQTSPEALRALRNVCTWITSQFCCLHWKFIFWHKMKYNRKLVDMQVFRNGISNRQLWKILKTNIRTMIIACFNYSHIDITVTKMSSTQRENAWRKLKITNFRWRKIAHFLPLQNSHTEILVYMNRVEIQR